MSQPSAFHRDLSAGTRLAMVEPDGRVHSRIVLQEDMRGDWASVYEARKDWLPDRRRPLGWSGSLPKDKWTVMS